ncbi:hypothetical protein Esti_000331 [Eimeria stiedai]
MRFVSSRGSPRSYSFTQALVSGAADDGGLLLPEAIPEVPEDVQEVWRRLSFPALLERILQLFVDPTEEGGSSALKLTEALPHLVSAAFRHTDKQDALEVQAIRLLRRRQRRADGSFWGSCVPDEPTRERPSIFNLLLRAARDRSSKKEGDVGGASRGKCRRIGAFGFFGQDGGEGASPASGFSRSCWMGGDSADAVPSSSLVSRFEQVGSKGKAACRRTGWAGSSGPQASIHPKRRFRDFARHRAFLSKQLCHGEADELFLLRSKDGAQNLRLNAIAMKFTAQLLDFLQTRPKDHLHLIVLCATTGDTGLVAAEAFSKHPSMDLVVLFSRDIRPQRRKQLTAVEAQNVVCVEVDGAFPDCQAMVQGALRSRRLREHLELREIIAERVEEARAAQEAGPEAALRRLQQQQQQQAVSLQQQPSQGSELRGEGETVGGDITEEALVSGLSLTPLQSRRFSLGRESGSFVRLPSHAPQRLTTNKRAASEGRGGPRRAPRSQPLRLCAVAPLNCVRLCIQIAFWWFAALKLKSLREEQAAALQELLSVASSTSSSIIARDVSSATASAALASEGGLASPGPATSVRERSQQPRDLSLMSEASEARSEVSAAAQQQPGGSSPLPLAGGGLEGGPPFTRPPNVIVPSGSYAVLFAAYFALAMGAPLGHLVPCVSASSVAKELGRNTYSDESTAVTQQASPPPHSLTEPAGLSAGEPLLAEEEGPLQEEGATGEGEAGAAGEGEEAKGGSAAPGGPPRFLQSLSSSYSGLRSFFQRLGGSFASRQKQERLRKQSQESDCGGSSKPLDEETLSQEREATVKSRLMRPLRNVIHST